MSLPFPIPTLDELDAEQARDGYVLTEQAAFALDEHVDGMVTSRPPTRAIVGVTGQHVLGALADSQPPYPMEQWPVDAVVAEFWPEWALEHITHPKHTTRNGPSSRQLTKLFQRAGWISGSFIAWIARGADQCGHGECLRPINGHTWQDVSALVKAAVSVEHLRYDDWRYWDFPWAVKELLGLRRSSWRERIRTNAEFEGVPELEPRCR